MQNHQVTIGGIYEVKVSGRVSRVQIRSRAVGGGWWGVNLRTRRDIRIKTAARLREPVSEVAVRHAEANPAKQRKPRPAPEPCTIGGLDIDNRITRAIDAARANARRKAIPADKLEKLSADLDMGIGEYMRCQDLKSKAALRGWISHDEAMTVYAALGETPDHFNAQDVFVKIVVTKLFEELLRRELRSRGVAC